VIEVLTITRTYPWAGEPQFGVFYQTQARTLRRLGAKVTVACPTPWAPWPLSHLRPKWSAYARSPRVAVDEGVTVIRPRYANAPGEPDWAAPDRLIARAILRAHDRWRDARIIHGHYSVTGLAAWRLARRVDLPYVLTFHGSDINVWPDEHPDRLADLRSAAAAAGAVFAVSQALADRVERITGTRAIALPLGSDHRRLMSARIPREVARRELELPDAIPILLFVGNLKPSKGVRELAEAVLSMDEDLRCVFVGGGQEFGRGLNDPRSAGRLLYRGPQPHDVVVQYLSAADVLILPSASEGLPTVLVEAGSLELPVIASNVGGIPELLGGDRGVILPEVTPPSIAAAIRGFLSDPTSHEAAARRLHALVRRDYDAETNARTLLRWYEAIVAGTTPR
jgi:teichuronic acid biosynthesis glycosyltransferase TuaC